MLCCLFIFPSFSKGVLKILKLCYLLHMTMFSVYNCIYSKIYILYIISRYNHVVFVGSIGFPEDVEAEQEDQETPQPSTPSGGSNTSAGGRRNPPGGKSSLILGWDYFFVLFFLFVFFHSNAFLFFENKIPHHLFLLNQHIPPCYSLPRLIHTNSFCHIHGPPPPCLLSPPSNLLFDHFFLLKEKTVDKSTLCISVSRPSSFPPIL